MGAHTWSSFHTCPRFSFIHATFSPHCDVSCSRPGNILNGNISHVPSYAVPAFYLIWVILAYADSRVFLFVCFAVGGGGVWMGCSGAHEDFSRGFRTGQGS